MNPRHRRALASCVLACVPVTAAAQLSLEQAIEQAQQRDPLLRQSQARQAGYEHTAIADAQWDDPRLSLGMMNLPTDTLDTDQENMTQLQLGLTQMLPRGQSNTIKARSARLQAQQQPLARQQRRLEIRREVSLLWLERIALQRQQQLLDTGINQLKPLVSTAAARYRSGISRQQDQLEPELALTRLQVRKQTLAEREAGIQGRLIGWLGYPATQQDYSDNWPTFSATNLPDTLRTHPELQVLNQEIEQAQQAVALAREAYKPAIGLKASYGYRQDMPNGRERADFISLGVSLDLPVNRAKRQDPRLKTAQAQLSARQEAYQAVLNRLEGQRLGEYQRYQQLSQRLALYDQQLLPQLKRKSRAAADAYGRDQANIAELTDAALAVTLAELEQAELKKALLAARVRLNYLTARTDSASSNPGLEQGGDHE